MQSLSSHQVIVKLPLSTPMTSVYKDRSFLLVWLVKQYY